MQVSGEDISSRGKSKCKGPEVGAWLLGGTTKWSVSPRERRIGASGGRLDRRAEDGSCRDYGRKKIFCFLFFFLHCVIKCVLGAILTLIGLFHNVSLKGAETRSVWFRLLPQLPAQYRYPLGAQ